MKPIEILNILDVAKEVKSKGFIFNPLFIGDAGLGKSQIVQQWVRVQQELDPDFWFLDLRLATIDSQDLIGFPIVTVDERGQKRTSFALPDMWKLGENGLVFFDEINRGNSAVLNTVYRMLTDGKILDHTFGRGVIFAAAINEDNGHYDVNTMDTALMDRFEPFYIEYDHESFIEYIKKNNWSESLVSFITSGAWTYKKPSQIANGQKYISPRTLSKMNAAEQSELVKNNPDLHFKIAISELGDAVGREYHKFKYEIKPLYAKDFINNKELSFQRLRGFCKSDSYRGDLISILNDSLVSEYKKDGFINQDLISEICGIIPPDQALNLIVSISNKHSIENKNDLMTFNDFMNKYPHLNVNLKERIKAKKREQGETVKE